MSRFKTVSMIVLTGACCVAARGQAVQFTQPPTAVTDGAGVRIEFAVSKPTDVAVTVLDAKGRAVRHLVAGMLGPNPPERLKADALRQSIRWDRKDDDEKPVDAKAGPFRVRVTAGLRPQFDRLLLSNLDASPSVHSIAAGPGGQIACFYKDPRPTATRAG